jgi:predicted HTH transcriptional regulator
MSHSETDSIEYKAKLPDEKDKERFEKSVVAFLNTDGGMIVIGADDKGNIIGLSDVDKTARQAADRIKNNILPAAIGLFSVAIKRNGDKDYIEITVTPEPDGAFYIREFGRSPKGCAVRIGTQNAQMPQDMIDLRYSKQHPQTLASVESPRQTLTFRQLKIYYEEAGLTVDEYFLQNLDFYNTNGKFNMLAYLMADDNGTSIKVARFVGNDPAPVEKYEFGRGCLLKAAYSVLDKLDFYNRTAVEFTYPKRIETRLLDKDAVREAALNALIHNDFIGGAYPQFSIYDDRLEISSTGGLPGNLTEEEFFKGRSLPRYRELMRIFSDMDLGEQLGSGMKKILRTYKPTDFEISKNFVIAKFMYNEHALKVLSSGITTQRGDLGGDLRGDFGDKIFELIAIDNKISMKKMAEQLGVTTRTIEYHVEVLKQSGRLVRDGKAKGGTWKTIGSL